MNASTITGHKLTGVQYGSRRQGQKIHLADRPVRDGIVGESHDSDALCGRDAVGQSIVWYEVELLREVGWDNGLHVCKDCLYQLGIRALQSEDLALEA